MTEEVEFNSEMSVEIIDHMGSDRSVLAAMMVSTKGEGAKNLEVEDAELEGKLNFLMSNRHGSPFEHAAMTFFVKAPIVVFREWHRHRIGQSYNEVSGRYTQMEPEFYVPPPERPLVQVGKPGEYRFVPGTPEQHAAEVDRIKSVCSYAYQQYLESLSDGVAKEVARGKLPGYLYSSMYVTVNPRSLMSFLSLRVQDDSSTFPSFPMWEIEKCAKKAESQFANLFPVTHKVFVDNGRVSP